MTREAFRPCDFELKIHGFINSAVQHRVRWLRENIVLSWERALAEFQSPRLMGQKAENSAPQATPSTFFSGSTLISGKKMHG